MTIAPAARMPLDREEEMFETAAMDNDEARRRDPAYQYRETELVVWLLASFVLGGIVGAVVVPVLQLIWNALDG